MAQTVKLRRSSVSGQKPTNSNLQLGELALNTTDGKVYMAKSGSLGPSVEELVTTNTFNTGSVNISGSINLEGNQTITGSLVVSDGVGFINNGLISENSNLLLTSGSNIYVQDGGIISGSALQGDGSGIINIPLSGVTNLTIISGSFDERINQITGSVDSINNFTSSVVLTSQTSSMTVMSASYALTASYALNASVGGGGGATGTYSLLTQTVAATTWSFEHNTGQRYPIFQVFNQDGDVIIPTQIRTLDENSAEIIFGTPQSCKVVASLGGGNGMTEEFTNSNLWIVDHNLNTDYPDVTIWDSNRNIIFPDRIESVNTNQIKVYFSIPVSGHVSVSRGGHIISGSVDLEWDNILNKPTGLVSSSSQISYNGLTGVPVGIISGSDQLTGSYDDRYVLSGSITQTTWDNIANKPAGIVSGSIQVEITGTTGYSTFSSSISTSIGDLSSSIAVTDNDQNGRLDSIEGTTSSLNSYTSSTDLRIDSLETESGSIGSGFNSYTSSTNLRLDSIETESGSIRSGFNSYTSSADGRLDSLETTSSSLLVLSSSIESAFEFTGSNVTIKGDLLVKGTETRVDSTTLDIGDNIISLNGSGATNAGLVVRDATAPNTISGSLLWDSTNDQWIAGVLGGEEKIILEGEFNSYTSSVNSTIDGINTTTNSLNSYTSSTDLRIDSLETESGSIRSDFNSYTSSNDGRVDSLETESGSIRTDFNTHTSSTDLRIDSLETESGSIRGDFNSYTSSNDDRVDSLETESGSIRSDFNSFTSSYTTGSFTGSFIGDGGGLYNIPASGVTGLNLTQIADGGVTASISSVDGFIVNTDTIITGSVNITGSIILNGDPVGTGKLDEVDFNTYTSSNDLRIDSLETESGSMRSDFNSYTSSTDLRLDSLETESGSIRTDFNTYTSSTDLRVDSLESKTGSYATTGSNSFIGDQNVDGNVSITGSVIISGSLDISNANVGSSRYLHTEASAGTTWTIIHNLGYDYPNVTVYDGATNKVMLPSDVTSIDANTTEVTFATPEYGYALVSVGGVTTSSADRYLHTVT